MQELQINLSKNYTQQIQAVSTHFLPSSMNFFPMTSQDAAHSSLPCKNRSDPTQAEST